MNRKKVRSSRSSRGSCFTRMLVGVRRKLRKTRWTLIPIIVMTFYIFFISSVHEFRPMRSEELAEDSLNLLNFNWMPECKQITPSKITHNTLISCDIIEQNPNKLSFKMVSLLNENSLPLINLDGIPILPDKFFLLEIECYVFSGPSFKLKVEDETSKQILPLTRGYENICRNSPVFIYFRSTSRYSFHSFLICAPN